MVNILNLLEKAFSYGEGRVKTAHWPSEATACPRQIVYSWMETPKSNPIDGSGWWSIKLGGSIHELCQSTLEAIERDPEMLAALGWPGYKVRSEVRSEDVYVEGLRKPFRFRMDITIVDDDGILATGEFKTMYGRGASDIKENGPKDAALAQVMIYQKLSRMLKDKLFPDLPQDEISRAYILYVSRDNGDRAAFVLDHVYAEDGAELGWILYRMFEDKSLKVLKKFPASLWDTFLNKIRFIEECVERGQLPDRPYLMAIKKGELRDDFQKDGVKYKSDWQCRYCGFKDKCWAPEVEKYKDSDNSAMFNKGAEDRELEDF